MLFLNIHYFKDTFYGVPDDKVAEYNAASDAFIEKHSKSGNAGNDTGLRTVPVASLSGILHRRRKRLPFTGISSIPVYRFRIDSDHGLPGVT